MGAVLEGEVRIMGQVVAAVLQQWAGVALQVWLEQVVMGRHLLSLALALPRQVAGAGLALREMAALPAEREAAVLAVVVTLYSDKQ